MDRRGFMGLMGVALAGAVGCRSNPSAEVINDNRKDMVGTTAAGAETYKPLIDESLGKLLARHSTASGVQPTAAGPAPAKRICFVGLENKSSEELGDFKEQIIQIIDTKINNSGVFMQISSRYAAAGLQSARLRPDELFIPANQRKFLTVMESQGQPFDYLLFATVTSGTTQGNGQRQKDYMLTLELVDIRTGSPDKESATLRKGYRDGH